jgi:hypothetical protein
LAAVDAAPAADFAATAGVLAAAGAAGAVGAAMAAFTCDQRVDRNRLPFLHQDLGDHATHRRRDFGVDLVRRDLEHRLVALDRVADLLEPLRQRALGDRLPHLGHHDVYACHRVILAPSFARVAARARTTRS